MPIKRVPVVHKFGIISQSQRIDLQQRLLEKLRKENIKTTKPTIQTRNADQLTDEFIEKFNAATSLTEIEKLEEKAKKIYERIKRKTGLKSQGGGSHIDLSGAWIELAQLAQCKGRIQEDCLDTLVLSLLQAPLERSLVSVLFFLAETVLYWLQTDAFPQRVLRSVEVKLLKLGELVFLRLFFHHMASHLRNHDEHKQRLHSYLIGFTEAETLYKDYADVLLCACYVNAVGKMIVGDKIMEMALENEGAEESKMEVKSSAAQNTSLSVDVTQSEANAFNENHHEAGLPEEFAFETTLMQDESYQIEMLRKLELDLAEQNASNGVAEMKEKYTNDTDHQSTHSTALSSSVHDLSPTLWHSLDVWRCSNKASSNLDKSLRAMSECSLRLPTENWIDIICALHILAEVARVSHPALQAIQGLICGYVPRKQDGKVNFIEDGNFVHFCPIASEIENSSRSSKDTEEVNADDEKKTSNTTQGMSCWPWQAAFTCTQLLADICINGATSQIQKSALLGNNKQISDVKACPKSESMKSAGLLDLLFFDKADSKQNDDDWSWMIRYAAVQGLMRICRASIKDDLKMGMRNTAWQFVTKLRSIEKDDRVHEALKIGQADIRLELLLEMPLSVPINTIDSKIAKALSSLYLPPALPPVATNHLTPRSKPSKLTQRPKVIETARKPLRTSLREEIMLATALYEPPPSFNERTGYDLRRIVEDQWRKDIQAQLEDSTEERVKTIEEKRNLLESAEKSKQLFNQQRIAAKRIKQSLPMESTFKTAPH